MDTTIDHEHVINLKLFKKFHFFDIIFNTKSSTIAGRDVYRLSFIVFITIIQCFVIFGTLGFVIKKDENPLFIDYFIIVYCIVHGYLILIKLIFLLRSYKKLRKIVDVARFDFLKSNQCQKYIKLLHEHRNKSIKISNMYSMFCMVIIIQWISFPLVVERIMPHNANQRIQNIINLPYPVTTSTFNQYFFLFFSIETGMSIYLMYGLVMIDVCIFSYGWVIITQYNVLRIAFECIGHEEKRYTENDYFENYNMFKSVIYDLQQLDLKVKLYYSFVRPIVLIHITVNAFSFIILAFSSIVICMSSDLIPVFSIFKFCSTLLFLGFQLSLYCYLFDHMNSKRESINYGIYSSNWTEMDIRFKKLVLLSMRITNANRLMLSFTPTKVINIQLFSNVMITSYNVITIMVKCMSDITQPSK